MQCSREEAVRETWNQIKRSVNVESELLRDDDLDSWYLDPDVVADPARPGFLMNTEPLLVNLTDTWALRPEATTAIPNLFLASDYVRTHTDVATMEAANEAARRAVNGLLDAVSFDGARCEIWPLHEPEILAPWRLYDAGRYAAGLPWDDSLMQVAAQAIRAASPVLDLARPLLEGVAPFVAPIADALSAVGGETDAAASNGAAVATAAGGGAAAGPTGFLDRLGWYREALGDTLAAGVPSWEPQRHLYALVSDFLDRAGKGLRPALCIATASALGGRAEDAYAAAAGIEMLHNAFLVHDDIEDGSYARRGAATMHRVAGVPIAVNAGDAMNALAFRLFRKAGERLGPAAAARIFDEVDHLLVETLEGQAMELGWVRDNDLTLGADDYLRLVLKKTAWYSFIHPLRIGALVADARRSEPRSLRSLRLPAWGRLPDNGRRSQSQRESRAIRQRNRRRSLGGETDPRADTRAWPRRAQGSRLDRRVPRPAAGAPPSAGGVPAATNHRRRGQHPMGAAGGGRFRRGRGARVRQFGVQGRAPGSRPRLAPQLHRLSRAARRVTPKAGGIHPGGRLSAEPYAQA